MANDQDRNQNQNPTTGSESDISKAQSQQQPPSQANQNQAPTGEQRSQPEFDQSKPGAGPDEGLQGDTATQQRTDVEGGSLGSAERGEAESGFVGSEGTQDTSSELVEDQEFKKDGDAIGGELKEESAKTLMRFRRGGGGGNQGPAITGAKGSAKFWIKDGVLTKYEYKVSGKMDFNGNEIDLDRTTTVEIKDVGKTKIEVPEGAKKKLS